MAMSKEKTAKSQTNRPKSVQRERRKLENPSSIYLQVIGTGANGTPRALTVFTTHQRYLFNCGEGTQRIANEHKIRLSRLENIFITHKNWDNIGGLPGLTLTVQDIGVPQIKLHGPPGIENLFAITRGFLKIKQIKISKHEYFDKLYEDEALKIESVPLFSSDEPRRVEDNLCEENGAEEFVDFYSSSESSDCSTSSSGSKYKKRHKKGKKHQRIATPPPVTPTVQPDISLAYICKAHSTSGRLLLEKCMEKGVPIGPLLGKLKNGEDITLDNGTIVLSKDVSAPPEPGPIFIVIECPTLGFLDSLINAQQFKPYQSTAASKVDFADVVVHFTPPDVINHPKYKQWMKSFSPDTHHLVLNECCSGIANNSVFRIQQKLNLIHPEIFPLLDYQSQMIQDFDQDENINITLAEPLLQYHLRPKTRFDWTGVVPIEPDKYLKEVEATQGSAEVLAELKKSLCSSIQPVADRDYPIVTFLGTGSSIPSRVRNVSSILVELSEDSCMLMDCGEGTYGQILRFFGREGADALLKKLTIIFISHLHADHHMGLLKILNERHKLFSSLDNQQIPELHLIAPVQIKHWLQQYHRNFNNILDRFILTPNSLIRFRNRQMTEEQYKTLLNKIDMRELNSVQVLHCVNAFGISFVHKDGWKMVYSGDTMPCEELIHAGENCDLLIHEATMEDDLLLDAKAKNHSTTSQAIEVGQRMKARFTMLTHFSQRYAKVPLFTENFHSGVGVAFDNMKVSLRNVALTSLFIPTLKVIFTEDYDNIQDRGLKRKMQREREQDGLSEIRPPKQRKTEVT